MNSTLFKGEAIGLLKGFSHEAGRIEVEVVVPDSGGRLPGFGEILLIENGPGAAIVGRVSRYQAAGRLVGDAGDAWLADLSRARESPPAAVVTRLLRYNLKLHLLGHLRLEGGRLAYAAGERALARFGSPVREPADAALEYLCNVNLENDPSAAELGALAYGREVREATPVRFSVARLKGRRSFIFARAGYGKSNLVKYLVSQLYRSPPDVGLLIFDPEGEYALPDSDRRPGLVNVPGLAERIALYTERRCDPAHAAVVRGPPQLDFGEFLPQDILAHFVPAEKQETVFANLLRGLKIPAWKKLVAYLQETGFEADEKKMADLIGFKSGARAGQSDVVLSAIKNNLVPALRRLHRPNAPLGRDLIQHLREARIVIVDTSLMGGEDARAVTGMLLWRVFAHNRRHFTDVSSQSVRCLAVLEEAQSYLSERDMDDASIFVRWVKEGRKYNLGAILVTQQPGAIADQIISQGDNFFVLHLLNERDLAALQRHNGYYTDDLLGVIRGEPIRGNCYFWSAPDQPFVLPVRVRDFASVASVAPRPPRSAKPAPAGTAENDLRRGLDEALGADERVWLYPCANDPEAVVFSADYLINALGEYFRAGRLPPPSARMEEWLRDELPGRAAALLRARRAAYGYAVLATHRRPAWRLPRSAVRLSAGKRLRPDAAEFEAAEK